MSTQAEHGHELVPRPEQTPDALRAALAVVTPGHLRAATVARQMERDKLDELISASEAEHGPIPDDEIQALRDRLHRAHDQHTPGRAGSA